MGDVVSAGANAVPAPADPINPTASGGPATGFDPWLIWHLHRLESPERHPGMPGAPSAVGALSVLLERPAGGWPPAVDIAPYYRCANAMIATGTVRATRPDVMAALAKVERMCVAHPTSPQLDVAVPAVNASEPHDSNQRPEGLTGVGVVVGFVDYGCAFAHGSFLTQDADGRVGTRVLRLWDQSAANDENRHGWERETRLFGYGRELTRGTIETQLQLKPGALDQRATYAALGYEIEDFNDNGRIGPNDAPHGTHVMDIAAGRRYTRGVAPGADIVFVQLPRYALKEGTDQASARHILDGVAYVFAHAKALNKPAVVNISYNAYMGPHDGRSLLERGLDELLAVSKRAVVVSAGNGHDKQCHASGEIPPGGAQGLDWQLAPLDPTQNFLEIWYPDRARVSIDVIAPGGAPVLRGIDVNQETPIVSADGRSVGIVIHRGVHLGNGKNHALVALHPPKKPADAAGWAAAPPGIWQIVLRNTGTVPAPYHAWIERDDHGPRNGPEQSHFVAAQQTCTLGGFCTGERTIVVGAYATRQELILPFSARGTTLDAARRPKPDVYAPGASDYPPTGVAAAGLSGPVRKIGTSVAAPFVTGLVALMFEKAEKSGIELDARRVLDIITRAATPMPDSPAGHAGRVNVRKALGLVS